MRHLFGLFAAALLGAPTVFALTIDGPERTPLALPVVFFDLDADENEVTYRFNDREEDVIGAPEEMADAFVRPARPLPPGEHTVYASCEGGPEKSFTFRVTRETVQDFMLEFPEPSSSNLGGVLVYSNETLESLDDGLTINGYLRFPVLEDGQSPAKNSPLVAKGHDWGLRRYMDTGKIAFYTSSDGQTDVLISNQELVPGQWYKLTATFDGIRKKLFINGAVDAECDWGYPLAVSASPLTLGMQTGQKACFHGLLDGVSLWSEALTQEQIRSAGRYREMGHVAQALVGFWHFDHMYASHAIDVSPNNLHAEFRNLNLIPTFEMSAPAPDQQNALRFNGSQWIEISDEYVFGIHDNEEHGFTLMMDVLPPAQIPAPMYLAGKKTGAWHILLDRERKIRIRAGGGHPLEITTKRALPPGEFSKVSISYWEHDGYGLAEVYINGEIDTITPNIEGGVKFPQTDQPLVIGGFDTIDETDGIVGFSGTLDNLSIWGRAVSHQELMKLTGKNLSGREIRLNAYWNFDEVGGNTIHDTSQYEASEDDTQVLNFNGIEPGTPLGDAQTHSESGYRIVASSGQNTSLTSIPPDNPFYTGSTALKLAAGDVIEISRADGESFALRHLHLFPASADIDPLIRIAGISEINGFPAESVLTGETGEAGEWHGNAPTENRGQPYAAESIVSVAGCEKVDKIVIQVIMGPCLLDNVSVANAAPLDYPAIRLDGIIHKYSEDMRIASSADNRPPAEVQGALNFDGADDYVLIPHTENLTLASFTIEAWIRPRQREENSDEAYRTILRKGSTGYGLALDNANRLVYLSSQNSADHLKTTTSVQSEVWQHIAVVVNRRTGATGFYINGECIETKEFSPVPNTEGDLVLGRAGPDVAGAYYRGGLDELRIWDHALDEVQIQTYMNQPLPAHMKGLKAYWNCNDGLGTQLTDAVTPETQTGTLYNFDRDGWMPGPEPPFQAGQYYLDFDGEADGLVVGNPEDVTAEKDTDGFTVEAWIYPRGDGDSAIVSFAEGGTFGVTRVENSEDPGKSYQLYWQTTDGGVIRTLRGSVPAAWTHVALTVRPPTDDKDGAIDFYVNGRRVYDTNNGKYNRELEYATDAYIVGARDPGAAEDCFEGAIDEIRVWGKPRTPPEIAMFATRQALSDDPHLLLYLSLNDKGENGRFPVTAPADSDLTASMSQNMTDDDWRRGFVVLEPNQHFWDRFPETMARYYARNPATAGLWSGTVSVTHVAEAARYNTEEGRYPADAITPVDQPVQYSILLHVDGEGTVRLLKDVILLQRDLAKNDDEEDAAVETENRAGELVLTLVTDEALLPEFDDIVTSNGRLAARRLGTGAYDWQASDSENTDQPPNTLALAGGIAAGTSVKGTLVLPEQHPTNPFYHRYHPGHTGTGFEVTRNLEIHFSEDAESDLESAGFGVTRVAGTYQETLSGLHKVPLLMKGTVELNRISREQTLNH